MRNAVVIPVSGEHSLVIASDNSGSIGMKENDAVRVPYETVGYFSFRVAVMELMATGAFPLSVVIHNFCGDEAWGGLVSGVKKGLAEAKVENVEITGSTESNFPLSQSAVGINVIGLARKPVLQDDLPPLNGWRVVLVGLPLVGMDVIEKAEFVAPLSLFKEIASLEDVYVWPVGSKGVLHELKRIIPHIDEGTIDLGIDLHSSGGPSTSFLAIYPEEKHPFVTRLLQVTGTCHRFVI